MSRRTRRIPLLAAATAAAAMLLVPPMSALAAPGVAAAPGGVGPAIRGTVVADGSPVRGSTVRLYAAGEAPGEATLVTTAITDASGSVDVRLRNAVDDDAVLYATARGGTVRGSAMPATVELAASLGDLRKGAVVIDELSTVAAGTSLAQFAVEGAVGGASPGLKNAALMPRNLVDLSTGAATRFLLEAPNGPATETLPTVNSLASIITGCVAGTNDCAAFLDAATDAWGIRPDTTWEAMTLLPANPSGDPAGVFAQVPANPRFTPVRTDAPAAWIVALRFYGNGRQFNGPGNIAFDAEGKVWTNQNATVSKLAKKVCPGLELFRVDPYSKGRPVDTYTGGGLNGSGFGISIDTRAHVWASNFGFTGSECAGPPPTSNSVSEFTADGQAISGPLGYLDGPISWPQGIVSDTDGDIWTASCGTDSAVIYPDGDHTRAFTAHAAGHPVVIRRAFDVAQSATGTVWVTANEGHEIFAFTSDGEQVPGSPFGDSTTFDHALGVASDSLGNVWVANSDVVNIPCAPGEDLEAPSGPGLQGSVSLVGPDGSIQQFEGAGMTIPWGIAVDGDDNVWVANFGQQRVSYLCGANPATCPSGQVGAPISPAGTGFAFDGLQRNTGVQVDGSGNVWLANNWDEIPTDGLADPFGDGLVVVLGVAAPIAMPLIGWPRQP
ncbi:hypothetical protein [Agromyces sp. NPDC055661]